MMAVYVIKMNGSKTRLIKDSQESTAARASRLLISNIEFMLSLPFECRSLAQLCAHFYKYLLL